MNPRRAKARFVLLSKKDLFVGDSSGEARLSRQDGFALLLVLWTMSLLAMLAAQVTGRGRAEVAVAHAVTLQAQLQAAADGAVAEAIWHLLPGAQSDWTLDQTDHVLREARFAVAVHVIDDRGKLDANVVSADLLASFFSVLGSDRGSAVALGNTIYAWRGGQAPENTPATAAPPGWPWGAPNRDFERLDELLLVPGMDPDLYRLAKQHLVLHMNQGPLQRAADPVVEAAIQRNTREHHETPAEFQADGTAVAELVASVSLPDAAFTRRATIQLAGSLSAGDAAYRILAWTDGASH